MILTKVQSRRGISVHMSVWSFSLYKHFMGQDWPQKWRLLDSVCLFVCLTVFVRKHLGQKPLGPSMYFRQLWLGFQANVSQKRQKVKYLTKRPPKIMFCVLQHYLNTHSRSLQRHFYLRLKNVFQINIKNEI